jgi:hypothetical protein
MVCSGGEGLGEGARRTGGDLPVPTPVVAEGDLERRLENNNTYQDLG